MAIVMQINRILSEASGERLLPLRRR